MGVTSTTGSAEQPTQQLVTAPAGDRCANCGSPLASDQRYCVSCGERRGRARFSFATLAAPAAVETVPPRPPLRPRMSSGSAFIAGIGVLLLAMGLGVLIGRAGQQSTAQRASATPPVQVVTVGGGSSGGAATSGVTTGPTNTPTTAASAHHTAGTTKAPVVKKVVITKHLAEKANAAASQVLGSGSNLPPPTVTTTGQACSSGAGCQNGQFTGNFFGQ